MTTDELDQPQSLFAGTEAIFREVLGIENLRHRSSLKTLSTAWPASHRMAAVIERLFQRVSANWETCRGTTHRLPSSQNWRWGRPVVTLAAHNRSPEAVLERAIVRASWESGRTDWCDQIPIASGVIDSSKHKRSALDLVRQEDARAFEFVELKIRSDTALFAALEIMQYGLIWLLSRRDRLLCGYRDSVLLDADTVHLRVLAPSSYYGNHDLAPFAEALSAGLRTVGAMQGDIALSFAFQEFPDALLRPHSYSDDEAVAVIETRRTR